MCLQAKFRYFSEMVSVPRYRAYRPIPSLNQVFTLTGQSEIQQKFYCTTLFYTNILFYDLISILQNLILLFYPKVAPSIVL